MFLSEKRFFAVCAAAAGLAAGARPVCGADTPGAAYEPPPFSTYQPILDRMPFGPLPSNFSPNGQQPDAEAARTEAEVKMEQAKLAKQVKLSCVNVSPDGGTMVGFSVLDGKTQTPLYLEVGDSRDGWTVADADYDKEWAKIEKDGVEITLKLGKGLVDSQSVAASKPAGRPVPQPAASLPERRSSGSRSLARFLMSRRKTDSTLREHRIHRQLGRLAPPAAIQTTDAGRSYTERLKERARKLSAKQAAKEKENQERLREMALEAARTALARQKEEEAAAAEEEDMRYRLEHGE